MTSLNTQDADHFATTQPGITFDSAGETWTIFTVTGVPMPRYRLKDREPVTRSGDARRLRHR